MKFRTSSVPYGLGTLLLVIGVIAIFQGSAEGAWPVLITGLLLYILGVLLDIHAALMQR